MIEKVVKQPQNGQVWIMLTDVPLERYFVAVPGQVLLNSLNLETEQTEILLYGAKIWFMR